MRRKTVLKKFILAFLTICCISVTCYGAVEFETDMESGKCTLFGTIEEAAFNQSVSIVIKDEEAKEVHVSYAKTDNDGNFTYTFKFGSLPSGEYEASLGAYGLEEPVVLDEKIYYASVADRVNALDIINSAAENYRDNVISEDDAIGEILSLLSDYARVLEVHNKLYPDCTSEIKRNLAKKILKSAPYAKVADFRDIFNPEFAVVMLCKADESDVTEIIEEMWDIYGFEEGLTFSLFEGLEDKTPVYERMVGGDYKTTDDVLDCFEKSVLLEILYKAENIADAKSVYDDFADILGFSYSDYPKWTTRDMAIASRKKYFKDIDELTDALDEAYGDRKQNQSGGGSSGGGGGSSSKGGSGVSMVPTPSVAVTEEKKPVFNDMQSALWANDAVEALYAKGIISGNDIGGFEPARNISREEFVKIIVNAFLLNDENASCDFTDVPHDRWSYPYVATAAGKGIVNGVGDNFFNTTGSITRQDMAVITKRVIDYVNKDYEELREYKEFSDSSEIADYAKDAVLYLYESGILNGFEDGSFKPQNTATRAEAAYLIYKIIS